MPFSSRRPSRRSEAASASASSSSSVHSGPSENNISAMGPVEASSDTPLLAAAANQVEHAVSRGQNLTRIARSYGVTVEAIVEANGLRDANSLAIGQMLIIPITGAAGDTDWAEEESSSAPLTSPRPKARPEGLGESADASASYTVRRGDRLADIARDQGVDLQDLIEVNRIRNANRLSVGQVLTIPGRANAPAASQADVVSAEALASGPTSSPDNVDQAVVARMVDRILGHRMLRRIANENPRARSLITAILNQAAASGERNVARVAYMLATAHHETGFGMENFKRSESMVEDHNPTRRRGGEISATNHVTGRRSTGSTQAEFEEDYWDDAYGGRLGNRKGTTDAMNFRGRGVVQITGRVNYEKLTKRLNEQGFTYTYGGVEWGKDQPIDLVSNPEHVNQVEDLAAKILVVGSSEGLFTGRELSDYIGGGRKDYYNARSVINGDKKKNGEGIAWQARHYEAMLSEWDRVNKPVSNS